MSGSSTPTRASTLRTTLACVATLLVACSEPKFSHEDADVEGRESDDAASPVDARSAEANDSAASPRDAAARDARQTSLDFGDAETSRADAQLGDASATNSDAAVEPRPDAGSSAQPAWASQLVGEFAIEAYTFAPDLNGISTSRELFYATITREGDELQLLTRQCELNSSGPTFVFSAPTAPKLPPRRHRILFQQDSFSTETIDYAIGYVPEVPECAGKAGQLIPAPRSRPWTSVSTCRCPGPTLPPLDDCRVIDADDDNLPGYTILGAAVPLAAVEVYGVVASYSKFIDGRPSPNDRGFVAQQDVRSEALQYACRPSTCANLSGPSSSCVPKYNRTLFVPLAELTTPEGGWTCDAVIARAAQLFPDAAPKPPINCDS